MKQKIHSIKYNVIMNFIVTASRFIFPLITLPYITRVLSTENYGKISFVAAVANYFIIVASLGIPTYGIRACARVRDDKEKLSAVVKELLVINILTTLLAAVIYVILLFAVPRFREDKILFLINGISIVLNFLGVNWFFQAIENYGYITARTIIFKALAILMMFMFVHQREDYVIYALITVFAGVGSNILNFYRLKKIVSFSLLDRIRSCDLKKHMKPILILFSQSITITVYTNLDSIMLGFMRCDADVGLYNVSIKAKGLLVSLVAAVGAVLLPRMSYYFKNKQKAEIIKLTSVALNATLLMSVPICIYFSLRSHEIIDVLAGREYEAAALAMSFTSLAVLPNGVSGVLGTQVLTSMEKEKYVLYSVIVGAISDFILNCILIPAYGASGAAFATMIAEYLVMGVQLYFTRDILFELRKDIRFFYYIAATGLSAALCVVLFMLVNIDSIIFSLIISAGVFFLVYFLCLILLKEKLLTDIIKKLACKIGDIRKGE